MKPGCTIIHALDAPAEKPRGQTVSDVRCPVGILVQRCVPMAPA